MDPKWYHVCWPRLTAKRVEPVFSISWASCFFWDVDKILNLWMFSCSSQFSAHACRLLQPCTLSLSYALAMAWHGPSNVFQYLNVGWNIRSQDYSFPRTFVPMMELSFSGPFVPWNFRSRYPGPFLLRTIRSFVSRADRMGTWSVHWYQDFSLLGIFAPGIVSSHFFLTNTVY